ncbi:MAG: response regulator [Planctomycetota bacterium]|nr:response regulator [Planctomycetota bacterium]
MTFRPCVLVLEDSDEDFDTFVMGIELEQIVSDLRRAESGEAFLAAFRAARQRPPGPCLAIVDLNVRGVDGREVVREAKADPELRATPLVVLTTSENPGDLELCYRAGANAYHVKPVEYAEHLRMVRRLLAYWLRDVAQQTSERCEP